MPVCTQQINYEDEPHSCLGTEDSGDVEDGSQEETVWGRLLHSGASIADHDLTVDKILVGRSIDSVIRVEDPIISTKHCTIERKCDADGKWEVFLTDHSSNGTFINGIRVKKEAETPLVDGAELVLKKKHMGKERIAFVFLEVKESMPHVHADDLIRKYKVDSSLLGQGSFAKVYKGEKRLPDGNFGASVAVKVIDKNKVQLIQSTRNCNLLDEVEIMKKISHPNVIKVHDVIDSPRQLYIVLEYANGGELFDLIIKNGAFDETQARQIFRQIVEAIAFLHDKGIAHRDLKPENILVVTPNTHHSRRTGGLSKMKSIMKITDFGLSRMVGPTSFMKTMCGTPQYLAPEVLDSKARGGDGYGVQVDMWSLGVILYVLNSGCMPFVDGQDRPPIARQISQGIYEFTPKDQWTTRSAAVHNLVNRLLTVQPKLRATAKEVTSQNPCLLLERFFHSAVC